MITFKTNSPFFEKERDGLKCNTVRTIEDSDPRLIELAEMGLKSIYDKIKIINPKTSEQFERQITDVTYYDGRFIISWKDASSTKNESEDKQ